MSASLFSVAMGQGTWGVTPDDEAVSQIKQMMEEGRSGILLRGLLGRINGFGNRLTCKYFSSTVIGWFRCGSGLQGGEEKTIVLLDGPGS